MDRPAIVLSSQPSTCAGIARSAWREITEKAGGTCWETVRVLCGEVRGFDAATQAMIAKGELVEVLRGGPADPLNGMPFPMYRLAEASQ